jgi:aspartyl/asparaginyl beta-hydroxylase (cupin superfamily)
MAEPLYFRIYGDYRGPGPVFYSREECPWLAAIERHWQTIRAEFEDHYYHRRQTLTDSYVPDDVEIRGWRSVNFVTYRHWYRANCAAFPRTVAILRTIPHLTSAFVNLLEPHARLHPHNGDTNTTYRCHLGLIVPEPQGDPRACGLEVGGERRGWREGEAFAFNEAFHHTVSNETDQDRVVLVFDVMKPAYRPRTLGICGAVLGAITVTALETRWPGLRRLPAAARRALHRLLGVAAGVVVALEREPASGGLPDTAVPR